MAELALLLLASGSGGQSSSSFRQNMVGGDGINDPSDIQGIPVVQPLLSNRSNSTVLKNFLRECHVGPAVITAIPDGMGLGMFISMSREDINELSMDIGIQMMLRTTQTLVKGELTTQSTIRPLEQATSVEERRGNSLPAPIRQPVEGAQEQAAATRDNVDPYLVSQSVDTPAGRNVIFALYGQHEGGVATEMSRLPSTTKGSFAPRGLFAITIPDLGVNLVSNTADQRALRVLFWHSFLMIGHHYHFLAFGLDQWGVDTAHFMTTMYRGLSLEDYNRTPSQSACTHMFQYQKTRAFQNPRVLLRLMTGKFQAGENGVQIESFETSKGAARGDCDGPDLLGRNKGIIECLDSLQAFIRTFINEGFSDVFAPVQSLLFSSEFLHRSNSKVLLKYLNTSYGVVFNALCTTTSIKSIAHDQPVSIKGIGPFGQALRDVSEAIRVVLSSKASLKTMEDDFTGRQAEDDLRLKVINDFDSMGDLTEPSPVKKRPVEDKPEAQVDRPKRKKQKSKEKKVTDKSPSPAASGVRIKIEPLAGSGKGSVQSPVVKRDGPCIYHVAFKLDLKDPNNAPYKCSHGVAGCRFRHLALNKIPRDKADKAAKTLTDLTLKALLLTAIANSTEFI
jgi:hypothetical protein